MKHLLEITGDAFAILCGAISLVFFITILTKGTATYFEPDSAILTFELIFSGIIVAIGLERLIDDLRH